MVSEAEPWQIVPRGTMYEMFFGKNKGSGSASLTMSLSVKEIVPRGTIQGKNTRGVRRIKGMTINKWQSSYLCDLKQESV